jgi:hypothetical protein
MNHSERVTELRKQIRAIDALLAKCGLPSSSTETQLEELYSHAQHFLKGCILVQERFKNAETNPELPDFLQLDPEGVPKVDSIEITVQKSEPKEENTVPPAPPKPTPTAEMLNPDLGLNTEGVEKRAEPIEENRAHKASGAENSKAPKSTQRLADKIHQGQIKDLRKALPLHEKFRFINELFKGLSADFDDAMHQFEQAGTTENALALLYEFQGQHGWDSEHPLVIKLIELIEKRFS